MKTERKTLWLLLAGKNQEEVPVLASTLAWMAESAGVLFTSYLESPRDGMLFAENGSTVIGGRHFQDFNYLCLTADVKIIRFGETFLFDSSIENFGLEVMADSKTVSGIYRAMRKNVPSLKPEAIVFAPVRPVSPREGALVRIAPYLYPEIAYRHALGFPAEDPSGAEEFARDLPVMSVYPAPEAEKAFPGLTVIDRIGPDDTTGTLTHRICMRWKHRAESVFFGDPAALLVRIPEEAALHSVPLYENAKGFPQKDVEVGYYVEMKSPCAEEAADLAVELGDRVIRGRQTVDGDILAWSKKGVCIQIVDPNRPAFPVIDRFPQKWKETEPEAEVDDDTLRQWAKDGVVLNTVVCHSGEIAHNEAMLNLMEFASRTGLHLGIGVHAQRYETCPQMWELLQVPVGSGGCRGLIEPVLHAGALGVAAEIDFPPELLKENILRAKDRIAAVAGKNAVPKGFYAFLDSDLATFSRFSLPLWNAVASAGMDYIISNVTPGRNRILARCGGTVVLNQSCRVLHSSSPFVRVTTKEDIGTAGSPGPGWLIASIDSPVIAFDPYIWQSGVRSMELFSQFRTEGWRRNTVPSVIARYAKILREEGYLPPDGPALPNGERMS